VLLDDVVAFLEYTGGVGDTGGWSGFKGYLPPEPDRAVAVFETPGLEPELEKLGSDGVQFDRPGFQVRIRGEKHGYEAARDRMDLIFQLLHGSQIPTASGDPFYLYVHAVQSGPMPMGLDENDRPGMTWNFITMRERVER
jgi:hypothetical protein